MQAIVLIFLQIIEFFRVHLSIRVGLAAKTRRVGCISGIVQK